MSEDMQLKKQVIFCGLNLRMLAAIIDLFLITIFLMPILVVISKYAIFDGALPIERLQEYSQQNSNIEALLSSEQPTMEIFSFISSEGLASLMLLDQMLQLSILLTVIFVFWVFFAGTPGKLLFGMKIADATNFEKPTILQLFVRAVSYIISGIPLLLGFFLMNRNKRCQAWHDRIANTVVIKK